MNRSEKYLSDNVSQDQEDPIWQARFTFISWPANQWQMAPVSIFQVRLRSQKPGEVGGPINNTSIGFGYWFVEDLEWNCVSEPCNKSTFKWLKFLPTKLRISENIWASSSATSGGVVYRGAKYAGPEGLGTHRRIQRLCPSIAYIHVLTCLNHQIPRFLMGNLRKDNCV